MARHVVCPGECSIALEKLSVLLLPSVRSGWLADWFAGSPRLPTLVWLFFPFLRWAIEARDHHFQFPISHFSWLLLNRNANLGARAPRRRARRARHTPAAGAAPSLFSRPEMFFSRIHGRLPSSRPQAPARMSSPVRSSPATRCSTSFPRASFPVLLHGLVSISE